MERHIVECRDGLTVCYEYWDEKECRLMPDIWKDKVESFAHEGDVLILNIRGFIDGEKKGCLTQTGFLPVGHSINMVYRIQQRKSISSHRFSFSSPEDWSTDEVFEVAKWHFSKDCRFCIDGGKEENRKNELLYRYIKNLHQGGVLCRADAQGWAVARL